MDGKGRLSGRNWNFSDHTGYSNLTLKPSSGISIQEGNTSTDQVGFLKMNAYSERNTLIGNPNSEASSMKFSWVPHRNFHMPTKDTSLEVNDVSDTPIAPEDTMEKSDSEAKPTIAKKQKSSSKKASRISKKVLKPKEPRKHPFSPKKRKGSSKCSDVVLEKKNQEHDLETGILDISSVPAPVCSCTGVPRQCYRWGAGGWQSSCCTIAISEYPLPMSSSRPGARMAGRKMSIGAYGKLLQRLSGEGHDLSYSVDLKDYWARHGTNKFVTIR
nr:BPC7 [Gladiolus x hybridus]